MTGFFALSISGEEELGSNIQWKGVSKVLGPASLKMPLLTIGMLGLQMVWSVEMSYASPYLISLGLSRSFMSIVFLAGPLSGLIVQPLIGVLSDRSNSRFGRRRPYIFFGIIICFIAMYLLGYTRQFANIATTAGSPMNDTLTIGLAVFSIFLIDFSINAAQAMDRALLVDILPVSEQESGNAWAGRMFGLGSVAGFFVGNIDLTYAFSFLGHTQLEILCVITSALLVVTHCITIFNVRERSLVKTPDSPKLKLGFFNIIKDIWQNFWTLPVTIKQICYIQLFAWIGWFPVLFWTSLYIGELHKRASPIPDTQADQMALDSEATRLGSRALLFNAVASLVASVVLPFFVTGVVGDERGTEYYQRREYEWITILRRMWAARPTCHLTVLWAISHGIFSICMLSTLFIHDVATATAILTLSGLSWAITQWAPFALIAEAIHSDSPTPAHFVLGDADDGSDLEDESIPLRDARTNRRSDEDSLRHLSQSDRQVVFEIREENAPPEHVPPTKRVHFAGIDSRSVSPSEDFDIIPPASSSLLPSTNGVAQENRDSPDDDEGVGVSMENQRPGKEMQSNSVEDKAGIILGIHNVFIVIPQFLITGISSIIFAILDPEKSALPSHSPPVGPGGVLSTSAGTNNTTERSLLQKGPMLSRAEGEDTTKGVDSVAVIFLLGGVSAAVACILAVRLARELKRGRR